MSFLVQNCSRSFAKGGAGFQTITLRTTCLLNSHRRHINTLAKPSSAISRTSLGGPTFVLDLRRHAGHNKWSKIRHTKGALDSKRGAQFAKIGLELIASIRAGGDDPQFNLRLAGALATARSINLPKKNIDNAFKKAAGRSENNLEEVVYQGMGPHQIAVVLEAYSDNKNRTVKAVRSVLNKSGGSMTDVSWMFQKKGKVVLKPIEEGAAVDSDTVMEDVLEADAEDFSLGEDKEIEVICEFEKLSPVAKALKDTGRYQIHSLIPHYQFTTEWAPPTDEASPEVDEEIANFLDALDALDDVVRVHTNLPAN